MSPAPNANNSLFSCACRWHWCCCLYGTETSVCPRFMGTVGQDADIILGERHLRHVLPSYMKYYNEDAPASRAIGTVGHIFCRPVLGVLHHQYVRI